MTKLTLEEPKFEGIFKASLTETGQSFSKTSLEMHAMSYERVRSDALDIIAIRNEIRRKLLGDDSEFGAEYKEKSRRNINYWQDKYGYEITEIITKGRIKMFLLIDSCWIPEACCEDWKLLIDDIQERGGKVAAYGLNVVGPGASELFFQANERYALADSEFRWMVSELQELEDPDRYIEEGAAIINLYQNEAISGEDKAKLLTELIGKFSNKEKTLIYLKKAGIDLQKLGMLSGLMISGEELGRRMSYSMHEALGLDTVIIKNPAVTRKAG